MSKTNIFLEDISYGIYDRPGPTGQIADEEQEITVPDEVPLSPSQHMSNQLSVQRPPIEDEEYIPKSIEELSRAAAAIAQLTPGESIEFFYKQLHKILDDATDKASEIGTTEEEENQGQVAVKEEALRRSLRNALSEALTPGDIEDYEDFRSGYSVVDSPDEDFEIDEPEQSSSASGEMSLDDLAKEFGYSGAPGIRQEIERLTNRLTYFATKVKKEDLDALVKYATGEFIETLDESGMLDPEDIEDLLSAPQLVKDLDSFRYFFVSAFVMPSYKKVVKDATKKVKTEISQLGIPKELHQTVFNQVTGATSRKPEVLKKKLLKLVKDGKLDQNEVKPMIDKINNSREALIAASDYSDDFVQGALDKWQSTSKSARVNALKQAMQTTLDEA